MKRKSKYSQLTDYQFFDTLKRGGITLNGRYFQAHKLTGTLETCLQYLEDNKYLEDHYNRFSIWRRGKRFYLYFGNC